MGSATHLMRNVRSGGMRIFNCEQNKNTAPVVSKCQPQKCAYVRAMLTYAGKSVTTIHPANLQTILISHSTMGLNSLFKKVVSNLA